MQIEGEFPQLLGIKESLIKYVFEPNGARVRCPVACLCASFGCTSTMYCCARSSYLSEVNMQLDCCCRLRR